MQLAPNADVYGDGAPEVTPTEPWPLPPGGYRLRTYALSDIYASGGMVNAFRTRKLMVVPYDRFLEPRDETALTPHSHQDFEQASVALEGEWIHHLRVPWTANRHDWRPDAHLELGSPSTTIIPAGVVHTSQGIAGEGMRLVDVFGPPRPRFLPAAGRRAQCRRLSDARRGRGRVTADAEQSSSRRLVHPSLLPALEFIPVFATDVAGLADNRAMIAAMEPGPTPPEVERSEIFVPGRDGAPDVRCLLYRPAGAAPRMIILHLHGGGFVIGRPEMSDARNVSLVAELGCSVLSVDYRLAPEHPGLPAWTTPWRPTNGLRTGPRPRWRKSSSWVKAPAAASPRRCRTGCSTWTPAARAADAALSDARSALGLDGVAPPVVGDHVWTRANNRFAWSAYLGAAEAEAGAAPALAPTVEGLPPTFILVGALDLFLEEDIDYARRLACAGVPTELHVIAGAYHGFDMAGTQPLRGAAHLAPAAALREV